MMVNDTSDLSMIEYPLVKIVKERKCKKEKVTLSRIEKVEFFFNKYLGNGIFIYYKIKGRRIKFIVNLKYKLFDSNRFEMEDTRSLGNFDATG